MIALFSLVRQFVNIGAVALAVAAALFLNGVYDRFVDDPAVAREARRDYVALAEKTALEAKLAEKERQRQAAETGRVEFALQLEAVQAEAAEATENLEQEISDYETQLRAAGRSCLLDDDTRHWLLNAQ